MYFQIIINIKVPVPTSVQQSTMANYKKPTRLKDKNIFMYNKSSCLLPENGLLPTKADMDLAIEFKLEILAVRSLRTSRLSWRR